MIYNFFDKKTSGGTLKNWDILNKELAKEFHRPISRKSEKRKVNSIFIDNIWGADLANMQLISKFSKGFRSLLCVIDIYNKYAWVVPLKGKTGITITSAFQKALDESNRKPNKTQVDKDSEFYNRSMKRFLLINDIEVYSSPNKGKSVAAERCVRTLKNKIHKYITSVPKNVYIDKLDDIAS